MVLRRRIQTVAQLGEKPCQRRILHKQVLPALVACCPETEPPAGHANDFPKPCHRSEQQGHHRQAVVAGGRRVNQWPLGPLLCFALDRGLEVISPPIRRSHIFRIESGSAWSFWFHGELPVEQVAIGVNGLARGRKTERQYQEKEPASATPTCKAIRSRRTGQHRRL